MNRTPTEIMETYLRDVAAGGRLELIAELAQPDMVDEANRAFGGPPGREGLTQHVTGFRRAIRNLRIEIDRIVAGENAVMAQWSFTGVHAGPWLGRAPTQEPVSGVVFSFFDLKDGRISRYRLWLHARLATPVVFDSARPDGPGA